MRGLDISDLEREARELLADELFSVESLPSIFARECAPVSWLVADIIPEAAVTMIAGDAGVGKSTLALALAGAVAHGGCILGREARPRKVLYLDRENPLAVVKERLARLRIEPTDDLLVWGLWDEPTTGGPESPSVIRFARDYTPLIVVDSLVAFHSGSEQDATETRAHMQHYRRLAAAGGSVVVLHHTGKSETSRDYRGSSDIKAAVDLAFTLEAEGDGSDGLSSLRLRAVKNRLAMLRTIRLAYTDGIFTEAGGAAPSNREVIERIIGPNPGMSAGDIEVLAAGAGVTRSRARAILAEGLRDGWLTVESTGRGSGRRYRLAEAIEAGVL